MIAAVLATRAGRALAGAAVAAVLVAGAYGAGWLRGYASADRAAYIAEIEEKLAEERVNAAIARGAEIMAREQADAMRVEAATNQERVHALEEEIASLPAGDVCRASDDAARRLRDIR